MNHRSNMDYILLSFLVAEKTAMSYAVGEWAQIWPLQSLIKAMGAFFVRRNSRNALYRRVLERYVNLATRAGVCQAVFLEGGLSRDGKLREPRLGFVDYMLREYHVDVDREIVFIPVGINYDRVIEDKSLTRTLDAGQEKRSSWFVIKTTLGFTVKTLLLKRKARWRRFGYASVNFGKPLSAKQYCQENNIDFSKMDQTTRFQSVETLSKKLMREIAGVIPVLPLSLMSEIILQHQQNWKSELELKVSAMDRIKTLDAAGAPIDISPNACEHVLMSALNMLVARHFVDCQNGLYRGRSEAIVFLQYYANSIDQWNSEPVSSTAG
jgi:glycerol-3-phosphate O-acyltransferase